MSVFIYTYVLFYFFCFYNSRSGTTMRYGNIAFVAARWITCKAQPHAYGSSIIHHPVNDTMAIERSFRTIRRMLHGYLIVSISSSFDPINGKPRRWGDLRTETDS